MTAVNEVIEGLQILVKTAKVPPGLAQTGVEDKGTANLCGAGHDIIYGPMSNPDEEDARRLEELGWFYDFDLQCWAVFV